jgi:hypothetical protein
MNTRPVNSGPALSAAADLVLFPCAPESDMISGKNILIDGDW